MRIRRDQWEEVDDLWEEADTTKPLRKLQQFTDGVGTISIELGDWIWQTLCATRRDGGKRSIKPDAVSYLIFLSSNRSIAIFFLQYQIRFLGYKGVVAVDVQFSGIFMRLRPSMNKFKGREDDSAEIEIAQAFTRAKSSCENFVMLEISSG